MKSKWKWLCCFLTMAFTLLFASPSYAESEGSWRFPILVSGENSYKAVQIDAAIFTRAGSELGNLRVIDGAGNHVPYFRYNAFSETLSQSAQFLGTPTYEFEEGDDTCFDFAIEKDPNTDVYGDTLELFILADTFAKEITLYGSHDGIAWAPVVQALVYRVDSGENTTVALGEKVKYSWFRVRVPNNAEGVTVRSVVLAHRQETERYQRFMGELTPTCLIEEVEGVTQLTIPATEIKNLRLLSLELLTDSVFSRLVETPLGSETLYNLTFESHSLRDTKLELPGTSWAGGDLVVRIYNYDDAPIALDGIRLTYACERICFAAEKGVEYAVVLLEGAEAPRYDIASYAEHILTGEIDLCAYKTPQRVEDPVSIPDPDIDLSPVSDQLILQIAIGLASLLMIVLIIRATRKQVE